MTSPPHTIKEKMLELTSLFGIERSIFQKFVIVYKYIRLLNTESLTKDVLQRIFDETSKTIGTPELSELDEDRFLTVKGDLLFSREFWIYYENLEIIHGNLKKMKTCKLRDKKEYKKLLKLFSKPYSLKVLALSFEIVNSQIFDHLDQESFFSKRDGQTWFDEKKSILHVRGKSIRINKTTIISNAHKLLHHIFITNKKNLGDDFYYSEIASDEFGEIDYSGKSSNWKRYHHSCNQINQKIVEQTNGQIKDFLVFNTGKRGSVKINKAHI